MIFFIIIFRCEEGSHVTFIIHFGDGQSKTVEGKMNYLLFLVTGEAYHQYTKGTCNTVFKSS